MSRPVLIRNGANAVLNIKDKSPKTVKFGSDFHIYLRNMYIPTFDLSSESIGGIVTWNNKPFGVVGVDSSITGDESIRIISIALMSIINLKNGDTTGTISNSAGTSMNCCTRYDDFINTNPPLHTYFNGGSSNELKNIPSTINSSNFYDGWARHKIWIEITDNNNTLPNWRTIETITKLSPSAAQTRGYSDSNICCWRYSPIDELDCTGYWYTPSAYELAIEGRNRNTIDNSFATILSNYNIGIGRIPYGTSSNDGFVTGDYRYSWWYGGAVGKYSVYRNTIITSYNSVQDSNPVQAWCKLIKQDGKWILDPNYHID